MIISSNTIVETELNLISDEELENILYENDIMKETINNLNILISFIKIKNNQVVEYNKKIEAEKDFLYGFIKRNGFKKCDLLEYSNEVRIGKSPNHN